MTEWFFVQSHNPCGIMYCIPPAMCSLGLVMDYYRLLFTHIYFAFFSLARHDSEFSWGVLIGSNSPSLTSSPSPAVMELTSRGRRPGQGSPCFSCSSCSVSQLILLVRYICTYLAAKQKIWRVCNRYKNSFFMFMFMYCLATISVICRVCYCFVLQNSNMRSVLWEIITQALQWNTCTETKPARCKLI